MFLRLPLEEILVRWVNQHYYENVIYQLNELQDLSTLLKLPREDILVRWVNYQLVKSSCDRRLSNFSADLKDSEIYTHLMARICPVCMYYTYVCIYILRPN